MVSKRKDNNHVYREDYVAPINAKRDWGRTILTPLSSRYVVDEEKYTSSRKMIKRMIKKLSDIGVSAIVGQASDKEALMVMTLKGQTFHADVFEDRFILDIVPEKKTIMDELSRLFGKKNVSTCGDNELIQVKDILYRSMMISYTKQM